MEKKSTQIQFPVEVLEIYAIRFCLLLRMARWATDEENESSKSIEPDDVNGAIKIIKYFRNNALAVIACVSKEKLNDQHRTVYDRLPDEFSTAEGIGITAQYGMKDHTFKMFLTRNLNTLFKRIRQGVYRKTSCYSANNVTSHENR